MGTHHLVHGCLGIWISDGVSTDDKTEKRMEKTREREERKKRKKRK